MKVNEDVLQMASFVNDLTNFIPLGVCFALHDKCFEGPGCSSPDGDGWKWLDFPYIEIDGTSEIFKALRFMVRRVLCRFTYLILDDFPGIALIRVYVLPEDSYYKEQIELYRKRYFTFKKPSAWLEKQAKMIMGKLYSLMDYSNEAFNIQNSDQLKNYLESNSTVILKMFSNTQPLTNISSGSMNFHLNRLVSKKPYEHYKEQKSLNMQERLKNVYANIKSPQNIRSNVINEDDLDIYDMINNNEISGFKSELYNFQKRSVLKMFERELSQSFILMPNIVEVKNHETTYYINTTTLLPQVNPVTYFPPRGGILAENMGFGKTCICLALICISRFQISETPYDYKSKRNSNRKVKSLFDTCIDFISTNSIPWKQYYDDFPPRITAKLESVAGYFEKAETKPKQGRATRFNNSNQNTPLKKFYLSSSTLVVLPDNLFYQWRVEIIKHVEKDFLSVLAIQNTSQMNEIKGVNEILNKDLVLISNGAFSKQYDTSDSIIKSIYWKRLIIDEGHSMNSKISRAVLLTKGLMYERMWIISGTPTSGLTNLHLETEASNPNEDQDVEYSIQTKFDPKKDLNNLGMIVKNFFKISPWSSNDRLWTESIIKPFERDEFMIEYQLLNLLERLMVRHTIADVENDIKLPKLHHKPVFLKPSFYDKLSINLFISVLATNAITSERKGVDYMFDPVNKSDLKRLVTNLQKGTFYWTGFSINDVENVLNICVYSLRENKSRYSAEDIKILNQSIFVCKLALSNLRWRSVSAVHEMGYFVKNLPSSIVKSYSLISYEGDISVFGYPHLISIQKNYYKNRIIKNLDDLNSKFLSDVDKFWNSYWKNIKTAKKTEGNKRKIAEDYKEFELSDVKSIFETAKWVDTFNPKLEESLIYENDSTEPVTSMLVDTHFVEQIDNENFRTIGSKMRNASIVGTLSSKLNYLTMRLLENETNGLKSIVFYEFENSAYYLTELMDLLGMNYLMYSSYVKIMDRSNHLAQFDRWDPMKNEGEGITLIMDVKLASHGLTIIAATRVFFINPVWNQSVEAQAIKRSHRIGQMNEVFVETLILENTLEERMYNMRNLNSDSDKVDLVDHKDIKDYFLTFPFLRIFKDSKIDEYSAFEVPTIFQNEFNKKKISSKESDDGVKLRKIDSVYNSNDGTRIWDLPLFSEKNLEKLANNENIRKRKRFDDIEEIQNEYNTTDNDKDTVILLEKLRNKRVHRHRVKFDV